MTAWTLATYYTAGFGFGLLTGLTLTLLLVYLMLRYDTTNLELLLEEYRERAES